jgi:hypothetical protein
MVFRIAVTVNHREPFRLDSVSKQVIECVFKGSLPDPRCALELDSNFKRLIKELGDAINESLSESERIADVMGRLRAAGYDLFLVLEVTIGFNKRGEVNMVHRQKLSAPPSSDPEFRLTTQDTQFLRALKITVDEDWADES